MIEIEVPHRGVMRLRHLVLDVNGTLALDGELLPGVAERLGRLSRALEVHLVTADTHGKQDEIDDALGVKAVRLDKERSDAEQKLAYLCRLGADEAVAVGNGANDVLMLRRARVGSSCWDRREWRPQRLRAQTLSSAMSRMGSTCCSTPEGLPPRSAASNGAQALWNLSAPVTIR